MKQSANNSRKSQSKQGCPAGIQTTTKVAPYKETNTANDSWALFSLNSRGQSTAVTSSCMRQLQGPSYEYKGVLLLQNNILEVARLDLLTI